MVNHHYLVVALRNPVSDTFLVAGVQKCPVAPGVVQINRYFPEQFHIANLISQMSSLTILTYVQQLKPFLWKLELLTCNPFERGCWSAVYGIT